MKLRTHALWGLLAAVSLSGLEVPEAPVADAAMRGDVLEVQALLRSGEDVNAAQGDGMTALHLAASKGSTELFTELLSTFPANDAILDNVINMKTKLQGGLCAHALAMHAWLCSTHLTGLFTVVVAGTMASGARRKKARLSCWTPSICLCSILQSIA